MVDKPWSWKSWSLDSIPWSSAGPKSRWTDWDAIGNTCHKSIVFKAAGWALRLFHLQRLATSVLETAVWCSFESMLPELFLQVDPWSIISFESFHIYTSLAVLYCFFGTICADENQESIPTNWELSRSKSGRKNIGKLHHGSTPLDLQKIGKCSPIKMQQRKITLLKINSSPLKSYRNPIGSRIVFQPPFFQGRAVLNFRGGNQQFWMMKANEESFGWTESYIVEFLFRIHNTAPCRKGNIFFRSEQCCRDTVGHEFVQVPSNREHCWPLKQPTTNYAKTLQLLKLHQM